MALRQEVNTPLVLTIGTISALVLLVTVFGTDAWFRYEQDREIQAKWSQTNNLFLDKVTRPQIDRLSSARVDPERKARTIPIDQAMEEIVKIGGKLPSTRPATTRSTK